MSARRISAGPLQDRRGGYQPPGGFSWGASWAMRPPFSFWLRQKENAPRPVEEKKSLLVATLHVRAKLLYGGRRERVPACLRGSPDGRGGVRYRLERGFPRRGCKGQRGARTHLTSSSFRAFRFATRCPGGRRGRPFWEGNNGTFPHQPFLRPYGDKVFNSSSPVTPSCASSLANGIRSSASPSTL